MNRNSMRFTKPKKLKAPIVLGLSGVAIVFTEIPTAQARVPNPPSSLTHTAVTQTGWTESWTPSANPQGQPVGGYDIYINGTKVNTQLISGTSYTVTGEQPGTKYNVTVE